MEQSLMSHLPWKKQRIVRASGRPSTKRDSGSLPRIWKGGLVDTHLRHATLMSMPCRGYKGVCRRQSQMTRHSNVRVARSRLSTKDSGVTCVQRSEMCPGTRISQRPSGASRCATFYNVTERCRYEDTCGSAPTAGASTQWKCPMSYGGRCMSSVRSAMGGCSGTVDHHIGIVCGAQRRWK